MPRLTSRRRCRTDAEFGFGDRHSCFVEGDGMDDLPEDTDAPEDEEEEEAAAAVRRALDGGGGAGGGDDDGDGDGGGARASTRRRRAPRTSSSDEAAPRASNQSVMTRATGSRSIFFA